MTALALVGGAILGAHGPVVADLLVDEGRVVSWHAPGGSFECEVIDVTGMHVMPGGVDVHTHLETVVAGIDTADNFESGTRAAAFGGTTTVVDFVRQGPGEDLLATLADAAQRAANRCFIDYGFHQIVGDVNERTLRQLAELPSKGVASIKLFMAFPGDLFSDDGQLLRAMEAATTLGLTTMVHAESGLAMEYLRERARSAGHTSAPWHANTAPPSIETEATRRAIFLAEIAGMPELYFVHVSSAGALDAIGDARRLGLPVHAETCPHYLFLDRSEMDRPWDEAVNFVCAPPLRTPKHQERLWAAIATHEIGVVSSDHCPFCRAGLLNVHERDFSVLPGGIAGIEFRLPLLYDAALGGRLTLQRFVEVTCSEPAHRFGLADRKGHLLPGADADIVVLDPRGVTRTERHHMAVDHSVYDHAPLRGAVRLVTLRGVTLVRDGEWVGGQARGEFLHRPVRDARGGAR